MAYQRIQVPTSQEINSNFTTLRALNLDTKEKFLSTFYKFNRKLL
jgi:hypothetical protein